MKDEKEDKWYLSWRNTQEEVSRETISSSVEENHKRKYQENHQINCLCTSTTGCDLTFQMLQMKSMSAKTADQWEKNSNIFFSFLFLLSKNSLKRRKRHHPSAQNVYIRSSNYQSSHAKNQNDI